MVNVTIAFSAFPINQSVCVNDTPLTLKPGLTIWAMDPIMVSQPTSIRETAQTDVQINLTSPESGLIGNLFNASIHGLAFENLTEQNWIAKHKSETYDPIPDTWGTISNDPNMPPVNFRVKNSSATAAYIKRYHQLNGTFKAELINPGPSPTSFWTPNSRLANLHISSLEGTPFEVIDRYPVALAVVEVNVDPGIQNFSGKFTANIINYSEQIELNAFLYFKYVINGQDPDNPHFIPLVVHIQNGTATKTVLPRPEIITTTRPANFAWYALLILLIIPKKRRW